MSRSGAVSCAVPVSSLLCLTLRGQRTVSRTRQGEGRVGTADKWREQLGRSNANRKELEHEEYWDALSGKANKLQNPKSMLQKTETDIKWSTAQKLPMLNFSRN